jgi:hypothetical protein
VGAGQVNGSPAPQAVQPPKSVQPAAAQQAHNNGAQVIPINRAAQISPAAAAPTTPIARPPANANQPTTALPPPAQRPAAQPPAGQLPAANMPAPNMPAPVRPYPSPAPQQQNSYPMAYQQAPRLPAQAPQRPIQPTQPAQYRPPQQQTYQAPRNKAPRQPQTYSRNAPPQKTGLSFLSKIAILVIVLAIAVALGVSVGKQLAKHRTTGFSTNRTSGSSVSTSVYEPLARR